MGKKSAVEEVVKHVERLLFDGPLQPGDDLPSETELSTALGVSRLTVREAVRSLSARGLVEVNHGRRPTVAPPNSAPVSDFFAAAIRRDPSALLELVELRLAVEVHTAELAARNGGRSDLALMRMTLEAMRGSIGDEDAFNEADVRFHAAVAAASNNHLMGFLVEAMEEPLRRSRDRSLEGYRGRGLALEDLIHQHQDIMDRIAARDVDGAAASMRRHLVDTRNDLRAVLSEASHDALDHEAET